mmetsp:Transcript_8877/g.20728  ORF Transcript_8877/g.20728 Transcript_8877/m.20728 type:complete len:170 (+) Transcript_8877:946-1455(+)
MLHPALPQGDTPSSSRLFTAIACGCAPIIISDQIKAHLPYASSVPYSAFATFVRERTFTLDPTSIIKDVTTRLRPRLPAIRSAMEASAPDLLYEWHASRVADHLLSEWSHRCSLERAAHRDARSGAHASAVERPPSAVGRPEWRSHLRWEPFELAEPSDVAGRLTSRRS